MAEDKRRSKEYKEHYLEQYKIYVASAEKISDRRDSANRYFLSINSALLLVGGLMFRYTEGIGHLFWMLLICLSLLGIVTSWIFYNLLSSYQQLNRAKFKLIQKIEKNLPVELYKTEWQYLQGGGYKTFSSVEKKIPWLFGCFYAITLIASSVGVIKCFLE